jgi:hypothetical protein
MIPINIIFVLRNFHIKILFISNYKTSYNFSAIFSLTYYYLYDPEPNKIINKEGIETIS